MDGNFGDDVAGFEGQDIFTFLRFHKVSSSAGCIACESDDESQNNWDEAEAIIQETATEQRRVDRKGIFRYLFRKETLIMYGTVIVSSEG